MRENPAHELIEPLTNDVTAALVEKVVQRRCVDGGRRAEGFVRYCAAVTDSEDCRNRWTVGSALTDAHWVILLAEDEISTCMVEVSPRWTGQRMHGAVEDILEASRGLCKEITLNKASSLMPHLRQMHVLLVKS